MNRIATYFLSIFFALVFAHAQAQQTTHAHSSSRQWKGIDVLDVLANPGNYPGVTGEGIKVYLYNVGTGRFAVDGGTYGMEARLFHEDFGRQLRLRIMDGVLKIDPVISEVGTTSDKILLTLNIPNVTKGSSWRDASTYSLTTIFDGYKYWGKWNFDRIPSEVQDPTTEFHTYYMYQKHDAGDAYKKINTKTNPDKLYQGIDVRQIMFHYGAAYGEWCSDGTMTYADNSTNDKGCGYYINVDDDRSCWTTAGNANNNEASPRGNTTLVEVNGDMVSIDELYQWRIISEEEFRRVLTEEVVGINPSISSLVPDRDFTRNSDDFFGHWEVTPVNPVTPPTGEGRYGNTWGNCRKDKLQSTKEVPDSISTDPKVQYPYRWNDEAWDRPLMLKKVFNKIKESKLGFMSFEGIGTVSVTFEVPQPGWYQVEANAINFATDSSHKGYMFAKANWVTVTQALREAANNSYLGYGQVELTQMTGLQELSNLYPSYFASILNNMYKSNEATNVAVGKVLTYEGEDIRHKFWIYLNPTNFEESDDNKKLTIGFQKDYAKKSGRRNDRTLDGVEYYYDEDWLVVDDIKISYMGLAPAFFYENEQSLDYLVFDPNYIDERPSAQLNGMYSGALSLERKMKTGEWNSFSFPIPLTGEQIRLAFGEDSELLALNSIGKLSSNSNMIDFSTVGLKPIDATAPVVEPGKLYLLKPSEDPVVGEDPLGRVTEFYQLGRNFFAVDPTQVPQGYEHTIIDTDTPYASLNIESYNNENDGVSHVSYISTPGGFDAAGNKIFTINANGEYSGNTAVSDEYVPKGAYALATVNIDNELVQRICEVNKDTPVKGFRGWLTLTNSLFANLPTEVKISVDGEVDEDGSLTGIDPLTIMPVAVPEDTNIYDLCGRRLGTIGRTSVPRGIYIVAGKRVFIK